MEIIIGMVIGGLLAAGGFFGRDLLRPTQSIVNIESKTYVSTEQKTEVQNYQASIQVTAVDSRGVYTNFSISIRDLSNIIKAYQTNTNYSVSITNR